jgi:hypothetical protein
VILQSHRSIQHSTMLPRDVKVYKLQLQGEILVGIYGSNFVLGVCAQCSHGSSFLPVGKISVAIPNVTIVSY